MKASSCSAFRTRPISPAAFRVGEFARLPFFAFAPFAARTSYFDDPVTKEAESVGLSLSLPPDTATPTAVCPWFSTTTPRTMRLLSCGPTRIARYADSSPECNGTRR